MQDLSERVREFMGFYDETGEARVSLPLWLTLLSGVLGLLLGLFIGWVLWPVEWENIRPIHLDPDAKAQYVASVADAYVATGETQDSLDLAIRRLSGLNVRQDLGLTYKYFGGDLVADEYAQSAQFDHAIRLDNLDRLSYALNIDPAIAIASVDMSGIATRESSTLDETGLTTNGQQSTEQSLDLLPSAGQGASTTEGGGFDFGQALRLGFTCLTALALILGGLYIGYSWLKNRREDEYLDDSAPSDKIGRYRDKPKAGTSGRADDQDVDEFDDYDYQDDDDGDFNEPITEYDPQRSYDEPDENWQTGIEEINPYRPAAAQSAPQEIAPFDPEDDSRGYDTDYATGSVSSTAAIGAAAIGTAATGAAAYHQASAAEAPASQQDWQQTQPQRSPSTAPQNYQQNHQQAPPSSSPATISGTPTPVARTGPADKIDPANVGFGKVLTQFTARYQRGTQQYEQQRAIVAPDNMDRGNTDGLNIGEYGMGVNIKNGILQSDAENVIALDVWLFDKTDQQGPRNQTRVLISEYVIDQDLSDTIMRDDVANIPPLVPQKHEEFEIRGTSLRLICKVIEAVYVSSGDMKGVFESVAVDMTVIHG